MRKNLQKGLSNFYAILIIVALAIIIGYLIGS